MKSELSSNHTTRNSDRVLRLNGVNSKVVSKQFVMQEQSNELKQSGRSNTSTVKLKNKSMLLHMANNLSKPEIVSNERATNLSRTSRDMGSPS